MHISEQVIAKLLEMGFTLESYPRNQYVKTMQNVAEAGQLSNGSRDVRLRVDATGRWLERTDGWGNVFKDVDLRDYPDNPEAAIFAVFKD